VESLRKNVTFVCPFQEKGLEIAFGLAMRRPDIPFVFVESWRLDAAHRRSLQRRIHRLGNVALRRSILDMRDVYRSTKLVRVPSQLPWREAWGRVVSEAQVSGIPVLASNQGGLPEPVGPGGILVDRHAELSHWEAALARVWDDPAEYERLVELARQHARRPDFQPAAIARQFVAVLSALVAS
jgi:glycosyltransferase involved in cell wall biosynthesis